MVKQKIRKRVSFSIEEKIEKLDMLIEKLAERSLEGAKILVEGINDAKALRNIGIQGEILCVKSSKTSIHDLLSTLAEMNKQLIILTDFDRRGTELAARIASHLEKHGKPADLGFRMKLRSFVSGDVKDIEGFASYVKTIKSKTRAVALKA